MARKRKAQRATRKSSMRTKQRRRARHRQPSIVATQQTQEIPSSEICRQAFHLGGLLGLFRRRIRSVVAAEHLGTNAIARLRSLGCSLIRQASKVPAPNSSPLNVLVADALEGLDPQQNDSEDLAEIWHEAVGGSNPEQLATRALAAVEHCRNQIRQHLTPVLGYWFELGFRTLRFSGSESESEWLVLLKQLCEGCESIANVDPSGPVAGLKHWRGCAASYETTLEATPEAHRRIISCLRCAIGQAFRQRLYLEADIDEENRLVRLGRRSQPLTDLQKSIVKMLLLNQGDPISNNRLKTAWSDAEEDKPESPQGVFSRIKAVKEIIAPVGLTIKNVRRAGYIIVAD